MRTDSCQDGQAQQLVAQKYLERPLLAFQRKFDLRQWVLVASWEPLTVWFYRGCYLRFCAEDYKPSNFDNIFCHLSNNSIAKKSRKFKSGAAAAWLVQEEGVPRPANDRGIDLAVLHRALTVAGRVIFRAGDCVRLMDWVLDELVCFACSLLAQSFVDGALAPAPGLLQLTL